MNETSRGTTSISIDPHDDVQRPLRLAFVDLFQLQGFV